MHSYYTTRAVANIEKLVMGERSVSNCIQESASV